jgi:hypothetical protein
MAAAWLDSLFRRVFVWFVEFFWLIRLNETNQINKTNQMNHANQTDEGASYQLVHERALYLVLPLPGPYALQVLADLRCFVQLRLDG